MINQKNTFVSLAEQLALLNKNSVEVITKLNDVVTSRNSVINLTMMNSDGTTSSYQFPTVGQLKNELDVANRNIRKLAGLADSTAYVSDGTTMRRIYVDDLNREPQPINNLNNVTQFTPVNNSFFESLSNPMLAIKLDLSDKVDRKVSKVLSRRYIISFQKDKYGNYTSDGLSSKSVFENTFLNRNDIFIDDLTSWYNNSKNTGVVKSYQPYDEQTFDLDYDQLEYFGIFDVVGVDNDTVNKKLWYVLGSITYQDYYGNTKQLSIGDQLIINKSDSSTRWQIKEVSTAKSNYRVVLERIDGLEPVPILLQSLKIYSPTISNKSIKVSIGYAEYNVIFIKPINTDSNIISSTWSFGTCFYTNDLVLDSNNTTSMTKFYSESVNDYGAILKDLVVKSIPSKLGAIPNVPVLDSTNFKVVQINTHLTDSADATKIKDLNSQKISVNSQLQQLNDAIIEKNKELSTKQYKSASDKQSSQNELTALMSQQTALSKLYTSIVSKITSENSGGVSTESPKFRVRGFFSFPEPVIISSGGQQQKQEVVQFKIQYRYSSKGGSEPTTQGFNSNLTETFYTNITSTGDITDQAKAFANPSVTTQSSTLTGYFSNWNQIISDPRQREYNKALDVWTWVKEDVTNANTPNINQLDIPLQMNEQVDIRVKSISEVGWPNAPIESDWSQIITIQFPDELSQVGDQNAVILQQAQNDQMFNQIENKFNTMGLTSHLQQSYYVNDLYVAHTDSNIGSSFKDSSGNIIMLGDYLKLLTDRITALEQIVSNAKGELVVKLFRNSNEVLIDNGASVNITINCEDYADSLGTTTRTYYNNIYSANDYYLQFENISQGNQLGLLSYRKYVPTVSGDNRFYNPSIAKGSLACYISSDDKLYAQQDNQFLWISDTSGSQQIYNSGLTYPSGLKNILYSNTWNIGLSGNTTPDVNGNYASPINIFKDVDWSGSGVVDGGDYQDQFPVTVHPYIDNIKNFIYSDKGGSKLINSNTKFTLPINIMFKLSGGTNSSVSFPSNLSVSPFVTRKIRIFIEPENLSRPFEFEIVFKIFRNRTYSNRILKNTAYPLI
jgi:hypothetical protein